MPPHCCGASTCAASASALAGSRRLLAGRRWRARSITRSLTLHEAEAADADDDNADFTLEVGNAAARAIKAFAERDYASTVRLLRPIRNSTHRLDGSQPQRDVLDLTLIEAARRSGQRALASALESERASAKAHTS